MLGLRKPPNYPWISLLGDKTQVYTDNITFKPTVFMTVTLRKLPQEVMFVTCIRKWVGSNLGRDRDYHHQKVSFPLFVIFLSPT
jgi:hypothetical protein